MMASAHIPSCRGFTLIEMIIAITVLGILSASTAVFLRGPIASYFDVERRTGLADSGELAMARLTLEISQAVPNSVRVTPSGSGFYLEFLPVLSGGRYRIGGPGNVLNFGTANTVFDALCSAPAVPCPSPGNWVVVNNDLPGSDVWAGNSRAALVGIAGTTITHTGHTFLSDAPDHRFQIAGNPVTYFCDPVAGTLKRYSGYGIAALQPQPPAGVPDTLATQITACSARFFPGNQRRAGLLALTLTISNAGDTLNLYHAIRLESLP
ncbi:MAG: prepilin-type N-terminal cleavage/methylation domain-containing protein [Thiobacillaceae bacterium]|jgi:MSHA biogenesis protein MshO